MNSMSSEKLEELRKKNIEERRRFVKLWAEYVRNHEDEEWSRQQNTVIDSQFE